MAGQSSDNIQAIRSSFKWNDPNIYQWRITYPKTKLSLPISLAITALALAIWPISFFALLWLIGLASAAVGFLIGLALTVLFMIAYIFGPLSGKIASNFQTQAARKTPSLRPSMAWSSIGYLAYVIVSPVSFMRLGFTGDVNDGIVSWLLFLGDNVLTVITLDSTEILGLNVSNIEPELWYSRLAVVVFRLVIAAGIIEFFLISYSALVRGQRFYGTTKDCYARCLGIPFHTIQPFRFVVEREGIPHPCDLADTVFMDDFLAALENDAKRPYCTF